MTPKVLWVYLSGVRVASLERDGAGYSLSYDTGAPSALSVRLPPRPQPYSHELCAPFFANLLPEGISRASLCRQLGVAPDDDFGLLAAIGGDCAGAVSIRPEPDWSLSRGRYTKTTESALRKWLKNPASRPLVAMTPGLRLSLAGAQDKLLVMLEGSSPFLCEDGAPSTVILKPDIQDVGNAIHLSAMNELLCMQLARDVGIDAPHVFWFASAFAVDRFDRERDGAGVRRLHQEDMAQVLGLPAAAKYQVTWRQAFELVGSHTHAPVKDRLGLLDRLLFNVILGNNDGHGKNFALLHGGGERVHLSPAYDLLCTQVYRALSSTFAMAIGPARSPEQLTRAAWSVFAKDVGLSRPFIEARGADLIERVRRQLPSLLERVTRDNPSLRGDVYPSRKRETFFRKVTQVMMTNMRLLESSFSP